MSEKTYTLDEMLTSCFREKFGGAPNALANVQDEVIKRQLAVIERQDALIQRQSALIERQRNTIDRLLGGIDNAAN